MSGIPLLLGVQLCVEGGVEVVDPAVWGVLRGQGGCLAIAALQEFLQPLPACLEAWAAPAAGRSLA
jgi:hypothetical protein